MDSPNQAALERHVLERVRRELGLHQGQELATDIADVARTVLYQEELYPDEEALAEELALETDADVLGHVLSLRVTRALRTAVGENLRHDTAVVVLRGAAAGSKAQADKQLGQALMKLRSSRKDRDQDGPKLWFLAAKDVFGKLCQLLAHKKGDASHTVVFEDGSHEGAPPEELPAVEIVETVLALPSLEAKAAKRVEEVRTASMEAIAAAGSSEGPAAPPVPAAAPGAPQDSDSANASLDVEVAQDPLVGTLFHKKYRIVRRIGRGGFGAVYEALDERGAGNRVAIKVLAGAAAESAIQLQAFKDEARRVTRLSHPNIVDWKVFDENEAGTPYFVMELVKGEEFDDTLRREGKLEPIRVAKLLLQVLGALRAAHHLSSTESILHLDLKPSNLFLVPGKNGQEEQLKVIDFGIGQYIGDDAAQEVEGNEEPLVPEHPEELDLGPSTLTFGAYPTPSARGGVRRSTGCTPEYASPEQCAHVLQRPDIQALDGRSDLYSLGVMGFQMLTGRLPFVVPPGERLKLLELHREAQPPSLSSAGAKAPKTLARFVERCLQKDPEQRFTSTKEAYAYLDELVHPPVWRAVVRITVPIVLALVAAGGWMWSTRDQLVPRTALTAITGERLDSEPLYLGPERPLATLTLASTEGTTSAGWAVVRAADGTALEGWSAQATGGGEVALHAPDTLVGRVEERVELVHGDGLLKSEPFTVRWLGADTWSVSALEIGGRDALGLGDQAVDPAGLALDLWVAGEARGDLELVTVSREGDAPMRLPEGQSPGDRMRYRLDLADLGLEQGQGELTLRAVDRAGHEWSQRLPLLVEPRPLAVSTATLQSCNTIGGRFVVSPGSEPVLAVELNRAADLSWKVVVGGEVVLFGDSGGRRVASIPIPDLASLRDGEPYSGILRLEADDSLVLHGAASSRGQAERELRFSYDPSEPEFSARWTSPSGSIDLDPGSDLAPHTNAGSAQLVMSRLQAVPMNLEASWWPVGREDEAASVGTKQFQNPQVQQATLDVALPTDGEYELRLRSYRFDAATRSASETPDVEHVHRIVLDRDAPEFDIGVLSTGLVVQGDAGVPDEVPLSQEDDGVVYDLELQTAGGEAITATSSSGVPLEDLWSRAGASDGAFALNVVGRDRAGNTSRPVSASFVVAKAPPTVQLMRPTGRGLWYPSSENAGWTLRLEVSDPNGVATARCVLRRAGDPSGEGYPITLVRDALSTEAQAIYIGSAPLPAELSEANVHLHVTASDTFDRTIEWSSPKLELPVIQKKRPSRVLVSMHEKDLGAMRLVEGNAGFTYFFGGRGDTIENAAYTSAGLPPFNAAPRRSRQRSWQVDLPPGSVTDYYLDEHEVTVGQFMAFLDSARCTIDEAERAAHRERLESVSVDLPVTGVTWGEAQAYAAWAGKRLPTLVQWEYAARGGAAYRPYPSWTKGIEVPPVSSQLEASGSGEDLSPDTGLSDLGGNVSEWTCTPADFDSAFTGEYPHEWARERRQHLVEIDGNEDATRFWIAGASFQSRRADFAVAEFSERDHRDEAVGFRCCALLEEIQDAVTRAPVPGLATVREAEEAKR